MTPPLTFSKKTMFVCVCVEGGVKALVGKQTKTHVAATLLILAARHRPHHKPQLTLSTCTHAYDQSAPAADPPDMLPRVQIICFAAIPDLQR